MNSTMKSRNLLLICFLILFIGSFTGCVKSENFFAYSDDKINKKIIPGTWDIEQLDAWIVDEDYTDSVLHYVSFSDPGNFEFMDGGECHFNLNGGSLDLTYLTLYSTDAWQWEYLAGSISLEEHFNGNVMYLDKKEMTLHFPWSLNLFSTDRIIIGKSVEFRFKLKKQ
jgi:hypothetical protein